jgi:hypothetical protein
MANDLSKVKSGDKFVTKAGGKIIEIRSKMREGFKVFVVLTGKETQVPEAYIRDEVVPYTDTEDSKEDDNFNDPVEEVKVVEEVTAVSVEEVKAVEDAVEEEMQVEKPKKKRGRKPGTKNSKEPQPNKGEKKMAKTKTARKETKKALILEMLQQGPQTRESLANAIIEKGLSKHNDLIKEKSYASVILHTLKKDGTAVCEERGKYVLAQKAE